MELVMGYVIRVFFELNLSRSLVTERCLKAAVQAIGMLDSTR
jgi:hypothetical protein